MLLLVTLAILFLDHRGQQLKVLRDALMVTATPVQYAADLPSTVTGYLAETLASRAALIRENRALRKQQLELQARMQRFEALARENERLRDLLHSSRDLQQRVLVAEFLSVAMDPFVHQATLDKGERDGTYVGQPLLDAQGVMGQITQVAPHRSQAMLITDSNHALPVEVNRNGLRAIAQGTGELDRLELVHVPQNADIREGDLLLTSGLGGTFPSGYPVGTVAEVRREQDASYARIHVTPLAKLDRTSQALLVWVGEEHRQDEIKNRPATEEES